MASRHAYSEGRIFGRSLLIMNVDTGNSHLCRRGRQCLIPTTDYCLPRQSTQPSVLILSVMSALLVESLLRICPLVLVITLSPVLLIMVVAVPTLCVKLRSEERRVG